MAEYIEREDTINSKPEGRNQEQSGKEEYNKGWNDCRRYFVQIIESQTAADVAPVVHGRWVVDVAQFQFLMCSSCGTFHYTGTRSTQEANVLKSHWYNYCPNCGAKMDGGKGDFIE